MNCFSTTLLLLLFGNGFAFSLSSSAKAGALATRAINRRLETTPLASNPYLDDEYDYEELMNAPAEQNRFSSQYIRFGHDNWLRHRASDRFYRNLFKFAWSPIVQSLLDEVFVLAVISLVIILWNELVIDGYTDFSGVHHEAIFSEALPNIKLSLPKDPFFLCGGPLGLLLVFRNDASFGRYKEAFHLWEKIVSSLSNMSLMAANCSSNIRGVRKMGIASWALCRTLQHELSGKFDPKEKYEKSIRGKLTARQADSLLNARNKLYRAQYDIHQSIEVFTEEVSALDRRAMINTVNDVAIASVECERLYTTPIPLLYTRHTLKFLTIWMTLMPFAFYDVFGDTWNHILMIPAISIVTFLFFGIEEIAVSLEEPFSILPLDELVEELYCNIGDTTAWMAEARPRKDSSEEVAKQQEGLPTGVA